MPRCEAVCLGLSCAFGGSAVWSRGEWEDLLTCRSDLNYRRFVVCFLWKSRHKTIQNCLPSMLELCLNLPKAQELTVLS